MALNQAEGANGASVCAIYNRQSSNTRSDLTSCQIQFEACEAFVRAHKHHSWRWIEEHFNDEGWSGASLDRPALQRLLAKIRNGEIDRILVCRLDRLSRSVVDNVALLNELRERGIDLVTDGIPPSEIARIANDNNWRTKMRKAKRSGKKTGGNPWTARQVLATLSNLVYMGKVDDAGLLRTLFFI